MAVRVAEVAGVMAFVRWTEAHWRATLWVALWGVLVVAALAACAHMPATRVVTGALVRVQHDESREAACGLRARLRDISACDVPPICCAYRLTVRAADGKETRFWAFWPKYAVGVLGLVALGDTAHFRLHARQVWEFPCTLYGCASTWDYVLDSDEDIQRP